MKNHSTNESVNEYEILKKCPSAAFLTEAHEAVQNRSFVEKIDWDHEKGANYLAILESVIRSFDTSTKLGECKAEAFTDAYLTYRDFVDLWNEEHPEEEQIKADKEMLDRWQDAVQDRVERKVLSMDEKMTVGDEETDELCAAVYVVIYENELEHLLALKNLCEQMGIELPDYETLKLEALTAIYDYYEWNVREVVYVDGDFETEECQAFYEKWKEALNER